MRIRATRAMLGCFLLLVAPSAVIAQEEGVTVDPDSPSGKEYSLPVDSARDRASGKTGQSSSSADDAGDTRFGEGLSSERPEDSGSSSTDDPGTDASKQESSDATEEESSDATEATTGTGDAASSSSSDDVASDADEDDGSNLALIGASVLVVGAAGGGFMRWRGGKRQ